jgi:hypothetical protein
MRTWIRGLMADASIPAQLLSYLWMNKRWWLIPMVASLILLGLILILATSSPLGPFIYTLF